eukprot:3181172-Rhodomonas_salina.2
MLSSKRHARPVAFPPVSSDCSPRVHALERIALRGCLVVGGEGRRAEGVMRDQRHQKPRVELWKHPTQQHRSRPVSSVPAPTVDKSTREGTNAQRAQETALRNVLTTRCNAHAHPKRSDHAQHIRTCDASAPVREHHMRHHLGSSRVC